MKKIYLGCHLSIAKGYAKAAREAVSIGANTFQFFTRNPRGGKAKDLDMDDVAALRELMAQNDFGPLVAHAPYTYNPCSAKERAREFALEAMAEDLRRMREQRSELIFFHYICKLLYILFICRFCISAARVARKELECISSY